MPRNLTLLALLSTSLGCLPQPADPPPAGPGNPQQTPGADGGGPVSASGPQVLDGTLQNPSVPLADGQGIFPEDAPHGFQIVVEGCQQVSVTAGADPAPAVRRVSTFVVPAGTEVLHVQAAWQDAQRKRQIAVGPESCPPCDTRARAKGHGSVLLEQTVDAEQGGMSWFAAIECDPAVDDLGVDTPTVTVEACRVAGDGGPRSLFPAEGLDQDSQSLLEHDAFGMQGFDGVKTATYSGGKLLAFVAVANSAEQARTRAEAYQAYLVALGGEPVPVEGLQGAVAVRTYGLTTILFTRSAYVGGVQEAADGGAATTLAIRLSDWLIKG